MTLPRIQPIAPTLHKRPFDDPGWLYDFKYDGFRALPLTCPTNKQPPSHSLTWC
jgi:ATP-dependent DNA ligase